jgi:heterodisulfide reductase subunit C
MDHTPRALFALLRAGERDVALRSNTPWICVSCYNCVVRCPQDIHITDVMYALKNIAIGANLYEDGPAPDFSRTFVGMVEKYGRSYELGLATRHYLRHFPLRLASMAPLGFGLISRKRLDLKPRRIRGMRDLTAILERARELEVTR